MNTPLATARRLAVATATTAIASIGFSPAAQALGLGNISVLSGLNQPLRAVVPLLFEEDETPDQLILAIARDDEANKFGALPNLLGQELDVVMSLQGDRIEALITTEFPVKEPHVDVVLHAQMGDTKHLRIYPVLLDLPISFFEPEIDNSYLEANINARTNWNGEPSDQQRDQMNEPASVSSLKVDGNTIEPIQVSTIPAPVLPTEDIYEETTTYIAAQEDDHAHEREIADNEISAIELTRDSESVGLALPSAVEDATVAELPEDVTTVNLPEDENITEFGQSISTAYAEIDTETPAASDVPVAVELPVETPVDEPVAVPVDAQVAFPVDVQIDLSVEQPVELPTETATEVSDFATAEAVEVVEIVEVDDNVGAVVPVAPSADVSAEQADTAGEPYPSVKPAIPVTLPEPSVAAPGDALETAAMYLDTKPNLAATDTAATPTLDLAEWAGTDAKLPLPEAVLLAEVPDDIGAPVEDLGAPRSGALRIIEQTPQTAGD